MFKYFSFESLDFYKYDFEIYKYIKLHKLNQTTFAMKNITKRSAKTFPVLIASVAAAMESFIMGFSLGYPSPIEIQVKEAGILDDNTFPIFSSCLYFVAIFGSLFVALVTELIGLKTLIILSSLSNALGWLMLVAADNWILMILGRCLSGFSLGASGCLSCVYIADISPKESRGFYGSMIMQAVMFGTMTSHLFGIFCSFRELALVAVFVLLIQNLILVWQPNSPSWLLSRGLEKRALETLKYLRGSEYDFESELAELKLVINEDDTTTFFQRIKSLFCEATNLRILFIVCFLFISLELTGISIVSSYSSSILSSSSVISPNVASLLPSVLQSVSVLLCTFLVDRVGRKPLLIFSGVGVAVSHVILSFYSFGSEMIWHQCSQIETTSNLTISIANKHGLSEEFCDYITLIPLLGLMVLKFMYGIGWGPIPYVLLGESLASKVRSVAAPISISVSQLAIALPVLVFPYLVEFLGPAYVFLIFILMNLSNAMFVLLFVPETRKLSFNEIQELFKSRIIFVRCIICDLFNRKYVYDVESDI